MKKSVSEVLLRDLSHLFPRGDCSPTRPQCPYVTLTYAQTLDGSTCRATGAPLRISGDESMVMTHQLRAHHDVIMVGIGTILADNPRLNTRLPPYSGSTSTTAASPSTSSTTATPPPPAAAAAAVENGAPSQPRPVVLDSRLRCPEDAVFLSVPGRPRPIIFCSENLYDEEKAARLEQLGASVVRMQESADRRLDLAKVLEWLKLNGTRSVMVEGGGTMIQSFLRQHLADKVVVTIAPVFLGGLRPLRETLPDVLELENVVYHQFGRDIVISGSFQAQ